MKTVCVTGIGGYVGLATTYRLVEAGYRVVGVGSSPESSSMLPSGVVYAAIDINDTERLRQFFADHQVEVVYHFAAVKYVGVCEANPEECRLINVGGTKSVLEAMVQAHVPHIIYASTYAVYAWEGVHVYLKEDSITKPTTVYGHTKLASEDLIIESAARGQVKTYQILRYANIIGMVPELTTHTPQSFIDKIVVASRSGEMITINGDSYDTRDGTVARDFVDVTDVADVHVQLAAYEQSGIFNVSSGVASTLKQIIGLAEVAAGTTINLAVNPAVATEPASIVVDSALIRNSLSWSNKKSLPDTIKSLSDRLAL